MKIKFPGFIVLAVFICAGTATDIFAQSNSGSPKIQKRLTLFNGKDLSNWDFYLKDPRVNPSTVFYVQNGVIHISGNPFGYMRIKKTFSNYKLHLEWRWPTEPTNSGVFIHAQLPDTIWIKCIECQLVAGNAGDFICNGIEMKEHTDKSKKVVKKISESSEKPAGEWNTMEIACSGNTIKVIINGLVQNIGSEVTFANGHICLQSEGKDVEFRNVFMTGL